MSQKIAVVGDCCLDILRTGTVSRMSPEAPECPVLVDQEIQHDLGMAANVGQWLAAVPGLSVTLMGLSGMDECSAQFREHCLSRGMKWIDLNRIEQRDVMTVKERVYRRDRDSVTVRQIVRLDRDGETRLNQGGYRRLEEKLLQEDPAAIVVADYGKGLFEGLWGEEAIPTVSRIARKLDAPLFVNSKYPRRWAEAGATMLVCNKQEMVRAWPPESHNLPPPDADYFVVTMSEHGAMLFDHPSVQTPCRTVHTLSTAEEVVDVTGAGDAFLAGLVYEMLSRRRGLPYDLTCEDLEMLLIGAQRWSGYCCAQVGVGTPIGKEV
jgi:rfaE bifunctional protein kinase chain/domain